jgi:DNA-binding SARP family transcriptional activator
MRLLGGFEVVAGGRPVPPAEWRRRQAAALVKLLALAPGRVLHREQVVDALWPDLRLGAAAPRLHKAAHYARRALRLPQSVVLSGETVALCPDAEVEVDAVRFQRLAESARDARTAGAAADAYPGDLLPHDRYEAWTEEPRERLRLLYLRMLRHANRWHEVVDADPADEPAHLALVRGMARVGDTPSAVRQLERLERGLRELGVAPSPAAVQVRDQLAGSVRRREVVVVGGPAACGRVVEAVAELYRSHPALSAGTAPIAVVIM